MATKNEMLKSEFSVETQTTTFRHVVRKGEGWETVETLVCPLAEVPENVQVHLSLYGIKGMLGDRVSDLGKVGGIPAKMQGMGELWELFKTGQTSKPRVATGGIEKALIHLVAELKGESLVWAESQLKALGKETREALAGKYGERLAELRKELNQAPTGGIDDLLEL